MANDSGTWQELPVKVLCRQLAADEDLLDVVVHNLC